MVLCFFRHLPTSNRRAPTPLNPDRILYVCASAIMSDRDWTYMYQELSLALP